MKSIAQTALAGDALERAVEGMPLSGRAKDTLMHMCNQSRQSQTQKIAQLAVDSPSGRRLASELHSFGLQKASDLLGYQISVSDGSLNVIPLLQKEAAA